MTRWIVLLLLSCGAWPAEACQLLREPIIDTAGNVLVGVSVTITKTNGGATATLYSDRDCTSTTTNPTVTGVDGAFSVFAKDGVYTLTPTLAGYSFIPVTNINLFEPVLENLIPNSRYATVDIAQTTNGAIDQIGSTVATLVITQPATSTANKTIPSTLTLLFQGKGDLTVSGGTTLTMNGPVINLTDHAILLGTGTTTMGTGAGPDPYGKQGPVTVTYSASMAIDASLGTTFVITATNATAFTINTPTKPAYNRRMRINIRNTSGGGLGAATFGAGYKLGAAWTQPATAFNRSIVFEFNGTNWEEINRTAADVSN